MKKKLLLLTLISLLLPVIVYGQYNFNENWKAKNYVYPATTVSKTLNSNSSPSAQVTINIASKISQVLPTQFGANFPFRNGSDQRSRSSIYNNTITSMRFPAGSGSNTYFWDGKIPTSFSDYIDQSGSTQTVIGIKGSNTNYMTPDLFVQFKKDISGEPIVVVNYFYARYGKTVAGTRAARVQQAANYAAEFVRKMNVTLDGNIKYWEVGNECYGKWEVGYEVNDPTIGVVTGKEYGEDFRVFVQAMKAVDPTIKVGAIVEDTDDTWNAQVLPEVKDDADFLSVHEYFTTVKDATLPNILNAVSQIETISNNIRSCIKKYTGKAADYFPIALTEFNTRGPYNCSMINGVFVSQVLGEIIKNKIGYASLWVSEWNWSDADQESKGFLAKNDPEQNDYTARQAFVPYYYYSKCFGDYLVGSTSTNSSVKCYASTFSSGEVGLVLVNTSSSQKTTKLNLLNGSDNVGVENAYWYEFRANVFDPSTSGYKKFYVNNMTSMTTGGGPDLNTVNPYQSTYSGNNVFTMQPYAVYYIVIRPNNLTTLRPKTIYNTEKIIPSYLGDFYTLKNGENLKSAEILGTDGRSLFRMTTNELNLTKLEKGMYILKAEYKDKTFVNKFFKK